MRWYEMLILEIPLNLFLVSLFRIAFMLTPQETLIKEQKLSGAPTQLSYVARPFAAKDADAQSTLYFDLGRKTSNDVPHFF